MPLAVLATLKNRQRFQTIQSRAAKRISIELRKHERDVVCETLDGVAVKQVAERTALLDGARRGGNVWFGLIDLNGSCSGGFRQGNIL